MTMVFKLVTSAQQGWRKLRGYKLIEKIIKGVQFRNGEEIVIQEKVAQLARENEGAIFFRNTTFDNITLLDALLNNLLIGCSIRFLHIFHHQLFKVCLREFPAPAKLEAWDFFYLDICVQSRFAYLEQLASFFSSQ